PSSSRHALRVIARGKRHHTARAFILRDGGELIVGAAELEGTRALQRLCLEKYAPAGECIEHRRGEQRCAQGNSREPTRGGIHVGGGRQGAIGRWLHRRTVAPLRATRQAAEGSRRRLELIRMRWKHNEAARSVVFPPPASSCTRVYP